MLYAKVVVGLPVEGPFDYIVPLKFHKKIRVGVRVWVPFRTQKILGYVVGLTQKTDIKDLKYILDVIDDSPILDKNMLLLAKELSDYYCCTFGEAIEAAIPSALRKGRRISDIKENEYIKKKNKPESILVHDLDGKARWDIYLKSIKEILSNNRSTIVLFPDIDSVLRAREIISANFNCSLGVLYRKQPKELEEWLKIKEGKVNIIIGTRSAIFAPLNNLGLIIIDEEQNSAFKQDQVPHYHSREVSFMRIKIEGAKLILGSSSPSLESFYPVRNIKALSAKNNISNGVYLSQKAKIKYIFIQRSRDFPEIKLIDTRDAMLPARFKLITFSKYLEDCILSTLNSKGKILLFLNRRGFATFASCRHCNIVLKCPRCNINLVYHFKDNLLNCHYCNFKIEPPKICPNCNSGYIRYSGMGTEKIESELFRLFPQAKIKRADDPKEIKIEDADIFIATRSIFRETDLCFDLVGVLSIDNSLNRIDLRSTEKTFDLLIGLLRLSKEKLIIQTSLPHHYCFKALVNRDINVFYYEELKQRRQLGFPPYKHLGLVKLRGEKESRVKELSNALFNRLKKYNKNKATEIVSVNPGQPSKLRGNFYWQVLVKSNNPKEISKFLKLRLKDFSHSGIIVTVDIDPI